MIVSVTIYVMDDGPLSFRIRTFEETGLPNISYVVQNSIFKGSPVTIMLKHEDSLSYHPLQYHPTVFANVGLAVVEPDSWERTHSTTSETQKQLQRGDVILYHKKNFFEYLDFPGSSYHKNETLTVVTLYKYDGSENPTLTYYFGKELPL